MFQVVHQTRKQKIKIYNKLKKRELIEMLLNNQDIVEQLTTLQIPNVGTDGTTFEPSTTIYQWNKSVPWSYTN